MSIGGHRYVPSLETLVVVFAASVLIGIMLSMAECTRRDRTAREACIARCGSTEVVYERATGRCFCTKEAM